MIELSKLYARKLLREKVYTVPYTVLVPANGTTSVHIKNPEDSESLCMVYDLVISTHSSGTVTIHDSFVDGGEPTGGSALKIHNNLMDFPQTPSSGPFKAYSEPTYNAEDSHGFGVIGGSLPPSSGGTRQINPFCMMPGREVVIEVENNLASDELFSFEIVLMDLNENIISLQSE